MWSDLMFIGSFWLFCLEQTMGGKGESSALVRKRLHNSPGTQSSFYVPSMMVAGITMSSLASINNPSSMLQPV